MGLLDDVLGSSVPKGNLAKPLLIALGALLASGALHKGALASSTGGPATPPGGTEGGLLGGLGGLLQRFQQNGHGDVINSWIGSSQNQVVSPNQLGSALGSDIIKALSARSGLSEQELTTELSRVLPGVVDKLTPNGRLPTEAEVSRSG
jgi:uncharacterized protein YidB (DUF937 family)